ncbi:MAG TPA: cbb3-type cytochrome c oxidase subunit I [Gemmatimonadaceae bacterium]
MDWFVRAFLKASLTWLGLGVTLGLLMAVHPTLIIYRPAHLHMNLLGFVTMMIYGVAYHVLPRFSGNPLHSRTMAGIHFGVANAGLLLLVAGFVVRPWSEVAGYTVLGAGGVLSAAGAYLFIYNLWRTLDGAVAARRAPHAEPRNGLTLIGRAGAKR